jgi:hypothetical protein
MSGWIFPTLLPPQDRQNWRNISTVCIHDIPANADSLNRFVRFRKQSNRSMLTSITRFIAHSAFHIFHLNGKPKMENPEWKMISPPAHSPDF